MDIATVVSASITSLTTTRPYQSINQSKCYVSRANQMRINWTKATLLINQSIKFYFRQNNVH